MGVIRCAREAGEFEVAFLSPVMWNSVGGVCNLGSVLMRKVSRQSVESLGID
jgi:hypothetical protein